MQRNVVIPLDCPLDPYEVCEMVEGDASGIDPPPASAQWVLQTDLNDHWASKSLAFSVWGRVPGQQETATLLWCGDMRGAGRRMLREDGSRILHERGPYFKRESRSP